MSEELFERVRFLLVRNGPMKIAEIVYELKVLRKDVLKILEDNPYTFDFTLTGSIKKWKLNT